jgi:hypothetical protein
MKERPIIFTPENAQKIFDGTKTQSRRLVKPQPVGKGDYWDLYNKGPEWAFWLNDNRMSESRTWKCPYGVVGDRLWVRECFSYEHGCTVADRNALVWHWGQGNPDDGDWTKPKPAIHMPRWACRTVVELTEVRVERLQDISEEDAKAEGCKPHAPSGIDGRVYRRPFECLWESINGHGSWYLNPWVWVLTFGKETPT